mmetsp:Transcript_8679/g.32329  ORF Transcript_8679/g.32329 Transcript_8679/m.32329 type:complete len:180 (+) Transcript_8679:41-580(+)
MMCSAPRASCSFTRASTVKAVPSIRRCNRTRGGDASVGVVAVAASPRESCASSAGRTSRQPALTLVSMLSCVMLSSQPAMAFDGDGASSFTSRGCVGCHAVGGNVVAPSATLFTNDLTKNGLNMKEDVSNLIALGRGKMPGYGEACAPKGACTFGARLDADEIDALATYVLERAANDWK